MTGDARNPQQTLEGRCNSCRRESPESFLTDENGRRSKNLILHHITLPAPTYTAPLLPCRLESWLISICGPYCSSSSVMSYGQFTLVKIFVTELSILYFTRGCKCKTRKCISDQKYQKHVNKIRDCSFPPFQA